jgi:hypothetical protein
MGEGREGTDMEWRRRGGTRVRERGLRGCGRLVSTPSVYHGLWGAIPSFNDWGPLYNLVLLTESSALSGFAFEAVDRS